MKDYSWTDPRDNPRLWGMREWCASSSLAEEFLHQTVGRGQIHRELALGVPAGAVCSVIQEDRDQLRTGATSRSMQRRLPILTAVHTCTWRRPKTQTPQLYWKWYVLSQFKSHTTLLNKLRISRIFGKLPCLCLVDVFWYNGMRTILMLLFLSQIIPCSSA